MMILHLPRSLEQVSQRFKGADPAALIVFAVAVALLSVVLVAVFYR